MRWAGVSSVAPRRGRMGRLTRSAQVGQVGREEPVCVREISVALVK